MGETFYKTFFKTSPFIVPKWEWINADRMFTFSNLLFELLTNLLLCCLDHLRASFLFFYSALSVMWVLFTQRWKCMRQVERFAPVLGTRWRIRHPCQQCSSVGLPINERIWASLPKRKKASPPGTTIRKTDIFSTKKSRLKQSLPEIQNSQSILWPFVQETNKRTL